MDIVGLTTHVCILANTIQTLTANWDGGFLVILLLEEVLASSLAGSSRIELWPNSDCTLDCGF